MVGFSPSPASGGLQIALVLLIGVCSLTVVAGLPTNIWNITLPDGTTNHGDPHLLCTPTTWTDILIFYFANYIAHAATVKPFPGELGADFMLNAIGAIVFPTAGIARGIDAIVRHSNWPVKCTQLQRAARAGALYMVVRSEDWEPAAGDQIQDAVLDGSDGALTHGSADSEMTGSETKGEQAPQSTHSCMVDRPKDWRPAAGDEIRDDVPEKPDTRSTGSVVRTIIYSPDWLCDDWRYWPSIHRGSFRIEKTIHGFHKLPPGYSFAPVPHDALVSNILGATQESSTGPKINICSVYDFAQAAAALVQSVYATITLYNSRGDQINRYGYAAFSLTVAPYALMSVINLIGGLLTSTYPTIFLVRSSIMDEAELRPKACFDGVIGRIQERRAPSIGRTFENLNGMFLLRTCEPNEFSDGDRESPGEPVLRIPSCPRFRRVLTHLRHAPPPATAPPRQRVQVSVFRTSSRSVLFTFLICYAVGYIPFAIVGGFSGFHPGESTITQRVLVLLWIVFGVNVGTAIVLRRRLEEMFTKMFIDLHKRMTNRIYTNDYNPDHTSQVKRITRMVYVISSAPAIGGFIIVGKMLSEYGNCIRLG